MTLRDWFLFISTFIIGILVGLYVYFTTFVPEYIANPAIQELVSEPVSELTILASTYGGCTQTGRCASYELTADRSYRYQDGTEQMAGSIPRGLYAQVVDEVKVADLSSLERPLEPANCSHFVDGVDYELTIISAAGTYNLDTCYTALDTNDPLSQSLIRLFAFMENPASYQATEGEGGVRGYLETKLDEAFSYDD